MSGSWPGLIFGVLLTWAMLVSYSLPGIGALPGRREQPRYYWTLIAIGIAAMLVNALNLIFPKGF